MSKSKVVIPKTKEKIKTQISVLESLLAHAGKQSERGIHEESLALLREALVALESIGRKKAVSTDKIKELREQGLTQEAIAHELGVSLSTVRRGLSK
jgi:DNA-binding transcriptional regulator YiaG